MRGGYKDGANNRNTEPNTFNKRIIRNRLKIVNYIVKKIELQFEPFVHAL